jgi:hypothetical protein
MPADEVLMTTMTRFKAATKLEVVFVECRVEVREITVDQTYVLCHKIKEQRILNIGTLQHEEE